MWLLGGLGDTTQPDSIFVYLTGHNQWAYT